MTPQEHYAALLRRISEWAVEEECGADKLPTKHEQDLINERLGQTLARAKIFHLEPYRHEKQSYFLRARAPIVIAHTANKWGKTFGIINRGLVATLGCAPWALDQTDLYNPVADVPFQGGLVTWEPPIRVTLVVQDYATSLPEDIIPRLKEIIPWDALVKRVSRVQGNIIDGIEFFNGSTWKILSHVQEDERFEGWSSHLILWNEPMPRSKYIGACRGALEFNARHLMAFTPISEPWIYDELYLKGHIVNDLQSFLEIETKKPEIVVVEGAIRDNPYLPEESVSRFEKTVPEHEREARLFGRWQHLSGLVYKSWSRSKHVRELAEVI